MLSSPVLQELEPKRSEPDPASEPEQMSSPASTRKGTTPPPPDATPIASRPALSPAPAVRMSFRDWKQKRAQGKQGKYHTDGVTVKEETHDQELHDVDEILKIEPDVADRSTLCASSLPAVPAHSQVQRSSTAPVNPKLHIDIPMIDVSFTAMPSAATIPESVRTPAASQPPQPTPSSKDVPTEPTVEASVTCVPLDAMDEDPEQFAGRGPLRKDSTNITPPAPSFPFSTDSMQVDGDDFKLDIARSSIETIRPMVKPDPTSLSIILPTPSPDAEDAEDGEIPPSPHDKPPLSLPARAFTAPVPPEPRRAPRSTTPLVHPPLVRRSPPGDRYRPSSPPRDRRPPPPPRSYRPDPPPPSLNSYRPSSPADSTSSPSDSPRHHSNTWYDDPRGPSSAGRVGDRWYGSSWRVSSSHYHPTSGTSGGPRSAGPRDHIRDRDYAPLHNFARGGWDSDRGGAGAGGRYMDRNRYPRDRDTRELIKQRGIEARAREAEVYKGRTAPPNPRSGP